MKFTAAMEVNSEDITDNLTQSQALQLIKEIDHAQAEWDFTVSEIKT